MTSGLRERKKRQTRQDISDRATLLFAQHGFDRVTIAQVAEAAGVSKMTVTNYFPRKEDLVFDRFAEIIGGLARAVRQRAPGESVLTALRRDYAGAVAGGDVTIGVTGQRFAQMVRASPVLLARAREIQEQREAALAEAIAADPAVAAGLPAADPLPRIVAAQLAAVSRVLNAEGGRLSLAGLSRGEVAAALGAAATAAFDLLEPGLGQFGVRAA